MTHAEPAPAFSPRLGVIYAAGDVGPSLTSLCLSFYWLYFLVKVAGLSPAVAGLLHGSGYAVSAIANLWAGHVLDRHLGAAKARAGLIAIVGSLMALLFSALWFVPSGAGAAALVWYLVASWAFHLLFSFVYLSYLSLTTLLTDGEHGQVDLSSYRFAATMTLSLVVLGAYSVAEAHIPLAPRLLMLGASVGIIAIGGSLLCGLALRKRFCGIELPRAATSIRWTQLARSGGLRAGFALNLAVWLIVQTTLVLTAFLCASLAIKDGPVLLVLQFATIVAAAGTSMAARRWAVAPLMAVAAAFWCSGALLWLFAMPFPAEMFLGVGLGSGTVLSWAEVARSIAGLSLDVSNRVEARAYAALTALRDLVSAIVPSTIGLALSGALFGMQVPPAKLLIAVAMGAAVVIALSLRRGPAGR